MADGHTASRPQFSIGVALDAAGWHPSAWREGDAGAAHLFTPGHWEGLVTAAESAGLDYATIEDSLGIQNPVGGTALGSVATPPRPAPGLVNGRLDAALIASWVAPRTELIGLIPTITTTHTEPFHVATGLQTLDHISLGRAGWQVRMSPAAADAAAFGRREAPAIDPGRVVGGHADPGLDELLREAADAVEVARRLWDSWEDDAIIRDASTGRFLDRDRLHYIAFEGERFSVIGPSIVPRSPQGQLPVTLLAHSQPIFELAARAADVVFITPHPRPDAHRAGWASTADRIVADIRSTEARLDREARGLPPLRIVADAVVALDARSESGADRVARLDALGTPIASDAHVAAGSAERIADLIEQWRAAGVDGVRLRPLSNARDLPEIGDRLLPELRRRGLAGSPAAHPISLRERFGLPPAVNRYASPESAGAPALALAGQEALA